MKDKEILNNKLKELPFQVPEGYFDDLPNRINERIIREEESKRFSIINFLKPIPIALAASLLLLFGLFNSVFFKSTEEVITQKELSDYVIESEIVDEIDLDLILDQSDLAYSYELFDSEVSNKEIEGIQNYLIDEEIDINDIINEL